jgi:hypothetical protein
MAHMGMYMIRACPCPPCTTPKTMMITRQNRARGVKAFGIDLGKTISQQDFEIFAVIFRLPLRLPPGNRGGFAEMSFRRQILNFRIVV